MVATTTRAASGSVNAIRELKAIKL
jgi:hypothetical protein